jgi:hypothetical protein
VSAAERLPELFTEAEAAERLGISKATLTRERMVGRIGAIRIGQRIIRYTDEILSEYLRQCESGKSATTGSAGGATPTAGAGPGSTPLLDRPSASRLAQQTFRPRKSA